MNNIEEAKLSLTTKPLKSTSFQRVRILNELKDVYKDFPQPLRFARVMDDLLRKVDIPLNKTDIIAGRYVDKTLNAEEEKLFQEFIHDGRNLYRTTVFETGHCTLDWDDLVESGLPGLKRRAEESLRRHCGDEDKEIFLRGAIGLYDALISFVNRYAIKAAQEGMSELAGVLSAIAERAPGSFYEGLQLCWIITFVDCAYITANPTLSLGRPDRFLYRLYKKDKERGVSDERIKQIITDYYCKHNLIMGRGEHQLGDESNTTGWGRILNFDAPQYLHLAGTDENGRSAVNELTSLFAECIEPGFKNPVVVVRYYEGMAGDYPDLWKTLMDKALKSCSMMIYNDNDVISAYEKMGLPTADARDYEHFGCNWAGLGKNSCWMSQEPRSVHFSPDMSDEERAELKIGYHRTNSLGGWTQDFMEIAKELSEKHSPLAGIEDFYEAFYKRVENFIDFKLENAKLELSVRRRHPSAILTLGDCMRIPPIETATANNSAAAGWYVHIQTFICMASVIDLFTVVDKIVFQDKKYTLNELQKAVEANFEGYDEILAACRSVKKFGSDDELSNYHAKKLLSGYLQIVRSHSAPYVKKYGIVLMPAVQSDTRNVTMGEVSGATFDGRLAGEPFSQNSRPSFGSCTGGLTGMLSSLLNLPMDELVSGALNLDIQPKDFEGESGRDMLGAIVSAYLDNGGLHVQISCQSVDELIDAQLHPEKHRDLMVRVTGYSGIFVDLSKKVQDYVIERLKQ